MRLLVMADDARTNLAPAEVRAEVLISCGDISDEEIMTAAGRHRCERIFAVKGNHDGSGAFQRGISDLHLRIESYGGLTFGGFNGCFKYKPRGNYLYDQFSVEEKLKDFPRVDVFVAHNSPRGVHERDDEVHVGFDAFSNYIRRARPLYLVHGHQHVNECTQIGGTFIVGTFGYRIIELSTNTLTPSLALRGKLPD